MAAMTGIRLSSCSFGSAVAKSAAVGGWGVDRSRTFCPVGMTRSIAVLHGVGNPALTKRRTVMAHRQSACAAFLARRAAGFGGREGLSGRRGESAVLTCSAGLSVPGAPATRGVGREQQPKVNMHCRELAELEFKTTAGQPTATFSRWRVGLQRTVAAKKRIEDRRRGRRTPRREAGDRSKCARGREPEWRHLGGRSRLAAAGIDRGFIQSHERWPQPFSKLTREIAAQGAMQSLRLGGLFR